MQRYEFRVIPAPRRGQKSREARTTEDRFALALTEVMNVMGRDGWDYVRADTLPCDERSGLTGTKTSYQNLLVFRRPLSEVAATVASLRAADPDTIAPRLLGAAVSPAGAAPALGPAKGDLAAE
ncbi:MAG: DUF4177 domain-containing protein [Pseudomonadota bacterium]|jgi:hypothetical protein